MKHFVTVLLALTAELCLTTAAAADAIAGPALVVAVAFHYLPWLLVIAVVLVTLLLLRKFRKKK